MREREARRILKGYCLRETGDPPSTSQVTRDLNRNGRDETWWLENMSTCPPWDGARTKAYFKAYVEIAGERFFGTGIPIHDKYLQPDRAVMKSLLEAGCVTLDRGKFVVTSKGQELLSSIPSFEEQVGET